MVWQEVFENSNVWVYEYDANGYKANAFAFALNGNHLAIISPPIGLSEADFAAIDAKGQVIALIAPHSGHDLGHAEWQARYPTAVSYAPEIALKQINQDGLRPFLPLSKLAAPQVNFREVPGTKKGGTIAIVKRGERAVVYLDEIVSHWTSLPDNWLAKFLFWSTGSAPGLKVNRVYLKVLCSDVQAVAQTVLGALVDDPVIVPAHGTPLVSPSDAERVRSLVEPFAK
uniref:MBL fold metallo-hydrolase n=1 Tax=Oscillatoriales cyanobacterium SpSt-402 TaxID=2282168 RepID=A0A832M391_9CYAN